MKCVKKSNNKLGVNPYKFELEHKTRTKRNLKRLHQLQLTIEVEISFIDVMFTSPVLKQGYPASAL